MKTLTVLGSGQDGGLPQPGAGHPNDVLAREGAILERTAASVLVETAGGSRLLIDASPDFRVQWWGRDGMPEGVVLTHAHIGHYAGLVHFGRESSNTRGLPCFGTPAMLEFLAGNAPWKQLLEIGNLSARPGRRFDWEGLTIDLIPVPHRAEYTDAVAVSIDTKVLYLPDIDSWTEWPEASEVIGRHEVALVDGTFWSASEVADRWGAKVPHPPVPDTIDRFAGLQTRVVLTHLNHTNPLCDPTSEETGAVISAGLEVAYDGMEIRF